MRVAVDASETSRKRVRSVSSDGAFGDLSPLPLPLPLPPFVDPIELVAGTNEFVGGASASSASNTRQSPDEEDEDCVMTQFVGPKRRFIEPKPPAPAHAGEQLHAAAASSSGAASSTSFPPACASPGPTLVPSLSVQQLRSNMRRMDAQFQRRRYTRFMSRNADEVDSDGDAGLHAAVDAESSSRSPAELNASIIFVGSPESAPTNASSAPHPASASASAAAFASASSAAVPGVVSDTASEALYAILSAVSLPLSSHGVQSASSTLAAVGSSGTPHPGVLGAVDVDPDEVQITFEERGRPPVVDLTSRGLRDSLEWLDGTHLHCLSLAGGACVVTSRYRFWFCLPMAMEKRLLPGHKKEITLSDVIS